MEISRQGEQYQVFEGAVAPSTDRVKVADHELADLLGGHGITAGYNNPRAASYADDLHQRGLDNPDTRSRFEQGHHPRRTPPSIFLPSGKEDEGDYGNQGGPRRNWDSSDAKRSNRHRQARGENDWGPPGPLNPPDYYNDPYEDPHGRSEEEIDREMWGDDPDRFISQDDIPHSRESEPFGTPVYQPGGNYDDFDAMSAENVPDDDEILRHEARMALRRLDEESGRGLNAWGTPTRGIAPRSFP